MIFVASNDGGAAVPPNMLDAMYQQDHQVKVPIVPAQVQVDHPPTPETTALVNTATTAVSRQALGDLPKVTLLLQSELSKALETAPPRMMPKLDWTSVVHSKRNDIKGAPRICS